MIDSPYEETYVTCNKKATPLHTRYYVTLDERQAITKELGDPGIILYEFYVRLASYDHPVITDEITAYSLCWTERKVRRYRQLLTKLGWFDQVKFKLANNKTGMAYYIGKEAVSAHRGNQNV